MTDAPSGTPPASRADTLLEFPTDFPLKIMGERHDDFAQVVVEVVLRHAPDFDPATLLNYGYNAWENARLALAEEVLETPAVYKGATASVQVGPAHDAVVTVPRGQAGKVTREIIVDKPVIAPVAAGQKLGTLKVAIDGKPAGEYPLVAKVAVEEGGFFRRIWDTIRLWLGL